MYILKNIHSHNRLLQKMKISLTTICKWPRLGTFKFKICLFDLRLFSIQQKQRKSH